MGNQTGKMKNTKKGVIAALLLLTVTACCKDKTEQSDMVGAWNVTQFTADAPELSPGLIQAAKSEALSSTYALAGDHSLVITTDYMEDGAKGTWSFDEKTQKVTLRYSYEDLPSKEEYQIQSNCGDEMDWYQDMGDMGSITATVIRSK